MLGLFFLRPTCDKIFIKFDLLSGLTLNFLHMIFNEVKKIFLLVLIFSQLGTSRAQCSFTGLGPNYCVYSPTVQLTAGIPGGFFSGPGITGSVFNPAVAGPGTHTITYGVCSSSYVVSAGTYSPYFGSGSTTTSSTIGGEGGSTVNLLDDEVSSSSFPIGFSFKYFCNTYSTFYIGSNGFITFSSGQSQGCCAGQVLPNTASPNNLITLTWADWDPSVGGSITYTTVGISPNRKLYVTFNNIHHWATTTGTLTAQLQLYETSNIIEIHTTTMVPSGFQGHTMGIKDLTGANGYVVPGRNSTTTWTASLEMYRYTPTAGCAITQTVYVSPSSVPVTGDPFVCAGNSASLVASGNTSYTWSSGSNAAAVTVTPATNTTYSVSATNSLGCISNSTVSVSVNNIQPTVTAVASNTTNGICPGTSLTLNASGASSYTWTGNVINGVAFSPTISSGYTVTGVNGCGTATAALSVSMHPLPPVTATASSPTLCAGSSLILTGGGAVSYNWSPLVANASPFIPTASNSYTVLGTSALGCTATAVANVTVYPTPSSAPLASPALICIGSSASLSATSGALSYSWMPGNSTNSVITVSPLATTVYTLIQSNSTCSNTRTLSVTVNQLPLVLAIVTPTLICSLQTAALAGGGGSTYTWTAPGFTANGASPNVSPTVTTLYNMTASDGTCVNTSAVTLSVNPNPTLTISASSPTICVGDVSTLTVNGAISYTWTPAISNGSTAVVSPTIAAAYLVTGDNSFGCTNSTSQVILVNQPPVVNVTTNHAMVCAGGSATLTASGSADTYSWNSGSNATTTVVNPLVTSVYSVTGYFTNSSCHTTSTVSVNVFSPTFAVSANTTVCEGGGSVTISASGALTYTWSTGSPFAGITVSPTVATIYTVSATSNSVGLHCVSSNTILVSIGPNPTVTATSNKLTICKGEKAILTGSGAQNYSWSNSATGATVQVSPSGLTTYTVTGTDANGCVSTGIVQVKVSSCSGIEELSGSGDSGLSVYPNPNNGEFIIQSVLDLDLVLINELGQTIRFIQLSNLNGHTVNVSEIANGIYFITGVKNMRAINQKIIVIK